MSPPCRPSKRAGWPAFADRFTRLVGEPPMQYLTRWRMQMAARLLTDGTAKVSAIALDVGYESEAAFSRAFKKAAGSSPAAWRQRRLEGPRRDRASRLAARCRLGPCSG